MFFVKVFFTKIPVHFKKLVPYKVGEVLNIKNYFSKTTPTFEKSCPLYSRGINVF